MSDIACNYAVLVMILKKIVVLITDALIANKLT